MINAATNAVLTTIPVGDSPARVAVAPDGARAYVTNTGPDSVSVIDTTTNAVVATVSVAEDPSSLAVTPDGTKVYVLAAGGLLQVINTTLIGTADDPVAGMMTFGPPFEFQTSIAILPDGARAYALVSGSLQVIDIESFTVLNSLDVGNSPTQLALTPDGTRTYVTNSFGVTDLDVGLNGQVVVPDTATDSVIDTISLFTLPGAIAVARDGLHAYVASVAKLSAGGETIGFLPDNKVAVIDLQTHVVSDFIVVPGTVAAVAVTPDGSFVYLAIPDADSLSVIETEANTVVTTFGVAAEPRGLVIGAAAEPATAQPRPSAPRNLRVSKINGVTVGS